MLAAGLPVVQAIDIIGRDQENLTLKDLIMSIKNNIASGHSLAESFSQYPQQFNDLFCSLIKAERKIWYS